MRHPHMPGKASGTRRDRVCLPGHASRRALIPTGAARHRHRFMWSLLLQALIATPVFAAICPSNVSADRCTARDLQPTGAEVVAGPSACTEGELISATVRVLFENGGGANARYDLGFFIGENGEQALGGTSCAFESLRPLAPPQDLTSGSGGYLDLDGDACGDLSRDDVTYRDISSTQILCQDSNGDGRLDVSYAISWDNNMNSPACTDPNDPELFRPDPPKCLSDVSYDLPITVEPAPAISVTKTAVPDELEAPGGDVTYFISVQNDSSPSDPVTITSLSDVPFGDLNGRGDCAVPYTLAPGGVQICSFTEPVSGSAGDTVSDTVTASGADDEGEAVSASDSATVTLIASEPDEGRLLALKIASPRELPEPGGSVTYTVLVLNVTPVPVELETLADDLYGDLDGQGSCEVPQTLQPGSAVYACQFAATATGQPGDGITDIVTAGGSDANGNAVQDQATASVTISDLSSLIDVRKTPQPATLTEPGGSVTFGVVVQNLSAVDDVTLNTLVDDIHGDLDGQGSCSLPQSLDAGGGTYECSFTASVTGTAGDFETDIVTATGEDDDGAAVTDTGAATVQIIADGAPPAPSDLRITKSPAPSQVTEPGDDVQFSLQLFNDSSDNTITVDELEDSVHGLLDGVGSCALPIVIAPDSSAACQFTAFVGGDGGDSELNIVIARGDDSLGNPQLAQGIARVSIIDERPALSMTKRAGRSEIPAPGSSVQFFLTVSNDSIADAIDLSQLRDSRFGDVNGAGTCALPQTIAVGGEYQCSFPGSVTGAAGDIHTNLVLAFGLSDDGQPVAALAQESVALVDLLVRAIPALGPWLLGALIMALAALGVLRLKRTGEHL